MTAPVAHEQLAEARRALGRQLADRRQAAGLTQTQLARMAGYARSAIANVETGRSSQPRATWTRYDQLLRADGALLAGYDHYATLTTQHRQQAARERERARTARIERWRVLTAVTTARSANVSAAEDRLPAPTSTILREDAPWTRAGPGGNGHEPPSSSDHAHPRLGGALAGRPTFDPTGRQPGRAREIDGTLIASHTEVAEAFAGMYRTVDPRAVLPMAAAYADDLLNLYHQQPTEPPLPLSTLVVGVHCQVGLWACHAGQTVLAHRYLATGCDVAAAADRPLQALALGALSYLHSSAPRGGTGGNPRRALELLTRALALAPKTDTFTRGWLATWRADQHATLGNLPAAHQDAQTAHAALDAGGHGPERGFFSRPHYGYGMREHLDSVRGLVHTLAGETDQAERTFDRVHTRAANNRRRVASLAHQGLASMWLSDPQAACAALTASVDLATADPYPMGLQRAAGVRARFDPRWASLPCVQELDERLRPLATTGR